MKFTIIAVLVLTFIWSTACKSQISTRKLLSTTEYRYAFDSTDCNSFGFYKFEDGEELYPIDIIVVDNFAIILDLLQRKLKKVDLNTGKIIACSEKITDSKYVNNLACFNSKIYVFTIVRTTFIYNLNLELLNTIDLDKALNGRKEILSIRENLKIYSISQSNLFQIKKDNQINDFLIYFAYDTNNNYAVDTIEVDDFREYIYPSNHRIKGKAVEVEDTDSSFSIIYKDHLYIIPEKVSRMKYYMNSNIDFSGNYVAWFGISKEGLDLHVYKFE